MTVTKLIEKLKEMPPDVDVQVMVDDSMTGSVTKVVLTGPPIWSPFVLLEGDDL